MARKPPTRSSSSRKQSKAAKAVAGRLPSKAKSRKASEVAAFDSAMDSIPATDELSRQAIRLGFLIHDVSRMRRAAYDQLMKPLNFTRARWWVLAHLSRQDGMMQSQLADVLEVGKASLGSVVEQLETDGWLERRADPSDKRAKRVYLTRSAQPLIKKMTLEEDQFNSRILASLNSADRKNLARLLALTKESLHDFAKSENAGDT